MTNPTTVALTLALMTAALPVGVRAQTPAPGGTRADTVIADTGKVDTFALPGVVVTATRVPLAREALPTPVTVWTGTELRTQGVGTVAEALERVPAATVTRAGSPGSQTSLFLRGGEADYVKVLVDGVAVNDPGGAVDLADLSTDQVERIEVVRGPVSVLYGSDAVAGVVQVFTRRGSGAPRVTAEVVGGRGAERGAAGSAADASAAAPSSPGSYGLMDASAAVDGSTGRLSYSLGGARSWSDGLYPFNSQRGHNTGTARVSWTPGRGTELALSTRYTDSRSHFPTDGTGALVDENARLDRRLWTTSATAGVRLHPRVDLRVHAGLASRRQRSVDPRDGPADTLGTFASMLAWELTRRTVDARADVQVPDGFLPGTIVSVGAAWDDARASTRYTSDSPFGPYDADAGYRRTTTGLYAQALAQPVPGVHLTLGGRLDRSDPYGTFRTYRVGAAIEPVAGTRLRGALGRGFKEPAFDQVFGSGFGDTGNPGLAPERSRSWEAGIEQAVGPVTLAATWFDQRFDQLIQFTFAPPNPSDPNYANVSAASARGLELEASARVGRLGITTSYAHLRTDVLDPGLATDAGFVEGEPLLRRPAHSGTLTARYRLDHGALSLSVDAVGGREDLDFAAGFPAPRVTLPGYAIVDLAAEHALPLPGPTTTALLRIENALDARYQSIAGFPGVGRVVRLGLRMETR